MAHNHTEHVQEEIHHHAAHGSHGEASRWITAAALTAAILAALAAVTAALATKHLTESTLKRIEANDNWNFYQAKSIKSSILDSRIYDAKLANQPAAEKDTAKKAEYEKEMPEIQTKAGELEKVSKAHLETHETYEMSATMFHIAIAVVAIAVVAKRKEFWYVSMVGGAVGLYFFGSAFTHAPAHEGGHEGTEQHAPATPGPPAHGAHSAAPAAGEATPHASGEHAPGTAAPVDEAHH
jgi:hypothetical protein